MQVKLSDRLQMSVDMAGKAGPFLNTRPGGTVVADIGCDHAHTCIKLVQSGLAGHCIGMDVRTGPLQKAAENLELYGCSDRVELRLSYGLDELRPGEADIVIIAGMGGELIRDILERDVRGNEESDGLSSKQGTSDEKPCTGDAGKGAVLNTIPAPVLILQPHSHVWDVRRWLTEHDYLIESEDMCREDDKFYPVILARRCDSEADDSKSINLSETEIYFGPVLLNKKHTVLKEFLEIEYRKKKYLLEQIDKSNTAEAALKRAEVETIFNLTCEARELCLQKKGL